MLQVIGAPFAYLQRRHLIIPIVTLLLIAFPLLIEWHATDCLLLILFIFSILLTPAGIFPRAAPFSLTISIRINQAAVEGVEQPIE